MNIVCPNCGIPFEANGRCMLCGAKRKSCTFHKWTQISEHQRVCRKCGRTQSRGLTYGWQ